ncbi:hypothetical protein PIB30_091171 [Stylosanthes scabra]|uniref:Uncharacterized protein n=1 Tax=Stylosanthes scabra TaxID=79078 RepID=A0ABU6QUY6_9FABA|nr:hypothetical protein [Stylosanthes scabra]
MLKWRSPPPRVEDVVQEEIQPEPLFTSKSVSDLDAGPYNLNSNLGETLKIQVNPLK